ncbi:smoothelin-like protein 1 [Tupaia chinensis]|uniref:smoothelin-like protein 1 n=1 Tax=Tupaia chinensis TaxID=246437 RepID=UPI000FFBA63C|nr:smoothelin-like protein 1 [Tupaia chinensis]
MEPKEEKPSENGVTVSPPTEDTGMSTEEETKGTAGKTVKEGPLGGAEKQDLAPAQDGISVEVHGEANGMDEVESQSEAGGTEEAKAGLKKEDGGSEETTVASSEMTDSKEETKSEPKETEAEETALASEKLKAAENEAKLESRESTHVDDKDKEAGGEEARMVPQEDGHRREEPKAEPKEEAKAESQEKEVVKDEAQGEPQEADGKEEVKSGAKEEVVSGAKEGEEEPLQPSGSSDEQEQDVEKESEGGAEVTPSSPGELPESPTEEGHSLSPDGLGPDSTASGETSPSASESSTSDVPQSPTEHPLAEEKKKEKAPERRVSAPARPRGARAQNRKAIVDKFGGAASGPTALFRNTKAAGAAVGSVKNMLLEWCRAMTRNYEHVDIQNFSSSWSSGMAFCALIHKFFPDAFDYAELDPTKRRHNFTLAFSTAEKLADCAQLLEVDDMVRLAVPDSKCVYTYIQELYRSLVQKGLVKTKKK